MQSLSDYNISYDEGQLDRKTAKIHLNKYRGGTSDATTRSSLILSLFMISFDDFLS